jgi:glycosyltransferase involved in cell wall biosynthesis
MPLKIAAKIGAADISYWHDVIQPMIEQRPQVEYVGEINDQQKAAFLGNATALLFPIDWPEPFGLVMIEAMSCGTPTLAFRSGSVPEVIEDGVSGFVVTSIEEAVAAAGRLGQLNRCLVRRAFERRFTVERMTRHYLAIYE